MTTPPAGEALIDVDFTLAIHNRTGKYFIGRDVLALLGDRVGTVYYGSVPFRRPPTWLVGRVLARAQGWQVMSRTTPHRLRVPLRPRRARPLLHLDPYTVLTVALRRSDIVLCHDIGPVTHPDLFEPSVSATYRSVYAEIARVGPHVVFVSRASEQAFHDFFPGAHLSSSRVVYPALRSEFLAPTDHDGTPEPSVPAAGPFLLTVGSVGDRKNQARCIRAFATSGLAERGVRYIICGGDEPGAEEVVALAERTPGVERRTYVSDAELRTLYRTARGFVLMSLLEGFGIPVAEAIAYGLVPLVTRGGVLHEVAGDGALAAAALDEAEIASEMVRLHDLDDAGRAARLHLLRQAIQRFDADIFANGWMSVFNDVVQSATAAP